MMYSLRELVRRGSLRSHFWVLEIKNRLKNTIFCAELYGIGVDLRKEDQ